MKIFLFLFLFFLLLTIFSCSKGTSKNSELPVFIPVQLHLMYGGSTMCSYGYMLVRQDTSSLFYHTNKLPANTPIPPSGLISISFHDTIIPHTSNCWPREIVIDSIKP